jgi:hypothetical protein
MIARIIVSGLFGVAALCWFGGLFVPALWGLAILATSAAIVSVGLIAFVRMIHG